MPVLKVWSTLVKTEIGKEYTLTWYTKGSGMLKTTIYHARANTTEGSSANVNLGLLSGGTLETMSDGWVKHTMNFTSAVGTGRIRFQTQKQADFYLDNISLVANDD